MKCHVGISLAGDGGIPFKTVACVRPPTQFFQLVSIPKPWHTCSECWDKWHIAFEFNLTEKTIFRIDEDEAMILEIMSL